MTRGDPVTGGDPTPPSAWVPLRGEATGADVWLADARADEAAAARGRAAWLARQADEEATLAGVLLELAEQGGEVRLALTGGTYAEGTIEALGADVVVLAGARSGTTVVGMRHVAMVHAGPRPDAVWGDRAPAAATTLHDVLAEWLPERPSVTIDVGTTSVHGELTAVGTDVVTVRTEQQGRLRAWVALDAIVKVTSRDRLTT